MSTMKITRLILHEIIVKCHDEKEKKNYVLDYLREVLSIDKNSKVYNHLTSYVQSSFFAPYFYRWKSVHRINNDFLKKYNDWLMKEIQFPEIIHRTSGTPLGALYLLRIGRAMPFSVKADLGA